MVVALAVLVVAVALNRDEPSGVVSLPTFILTLIGVLLGFAGIVGVSEWVEMRNVRLGKPSRQLQIKELTGALEKAMRVVGTIKAEVEEGDRLLTELERRSDIAQQLARLDDPQVVAVTEHIRGELRAEGRRSLRRDLALGSAFFLLGVLVTLLLR